MLDTGAGLSGVWRRRILLLRRTRNGRLFASSGPGLGIDTDIDALGEPVRVYR